MPFVYRDDEAIQTFKEQDMTTMASENKRTAVPVPSKQQTAYKALNWFHDTLKTESAMYIRFQTLPQNYAEALRRFYKCKTEMDIFSYICKWWNIRCA